MLLSLSGFLFEDRYTSQSVTFPEFCEIASSAGYDGVELRRTQVNPDTPKHQRKQRFAIVRDAGLRVTCLTARGLPSTGAEREDFFLRVLELCRDLECGLLKIGSDPPWLHEAAAKAQAFGVTLASNNHVGGVLETVAGTRRTLQEIVHPNFGLLYDALHLRVAGEDYLGCIPEFVQATRNILVHSVRPAQLGEHVVLDRAGQRWTPALPDEQGVQDWAAIFETFRRLKYDGLITVIESGWPVERRAYVARHCAEVIRRLWSGL